MGLLGILWTISLASGKGAVMLIITTKIPPFLECRGMTAMR
jgi:hypothetical protein